MEPNFSYQWQFGIKPNTLANLVVAGRKTATCSGYCFYALENQPLPQKGEKHIVLDSQNQAVVCIQLSEVFIEHFNEVTEEFALAEGEGDYQSWKIAHRDFFKGELGKEIDEHFEVVCERFYAVNIFPKTYAEWLTFAEQTLLENAENNPFLDAKFDANLLLQAVTKRTKSAIFAFSETILTENELKQLAEYLARRANGEPMAYILGEREFWSLPLKVSTATLIPRPDTERLVELALDFAYKRLEKQKNLQILDLGTGTGAIALAMASELGDKADIIGVDFQSKAVKLAEENRQNLGFDNIRFLQSDWFSAIKNQQFDLILSNPPYIDAEDENLTVGDVRFEPLTALVADNQGLSDLQKIIENAPLYLKHQGTLMLEHGWQQGEQVRNLFDPNLWENIATVQDYGGNDRVTQAILK
ncbi:peptide chain release factor N(5)-glutamine methyltransferase [Mannheimia indoligenes]|uniref:peptide chain release factor N(5)-glutamine methyltransferase n=1 Tax=Mannheimia indoligenes TaxID=3103145 RepID=UPI003D165C03